MLYPDIELMLKTLDPRSLQSMRSLPLVAHLQGNHPSSEWDLYFRQATSFALCRLLSAQQLDVHGTQCYNAVPTLYFNRCQGTTSRFTHWPLKSIRLQGSLVRAYNANALLEDGQTHLKLGNT